MMTDYFAQFEGLEVDGKRYALGDQISAKVDAGTLAYLSSVGQIGASRPALAIMVPAAEVPLSEMTREQLVATFRAELVIPDDLDDDRLRDAIEAQRLGLAPADDDDGEPVKPLDKMTKAELLDVAANEGVTFGEDVTNNAERVTAIEAARAARATA